jgi:hypothetical protein
MEKFQLTLLLKIAGIGSASGLLYQNDKLYIISDNSNYLYEYKMSEEKLNKIALTENPKENIPKKEKPDFEAISHKGNEIIILGSGSTENRNKVIQYKSSSKKVKEKDFTEMYKLIKSQLSITDEELNIEGLIITEETIYFFQRGNGESGKNGIIFSEDVAQSPKFKFIPFDLPKIKNVAPTFTDAILVDDKIYFLAAAEDTNSTYLDGEVLGSIIGQIDFKTLKLEKTIQITEKNKFEGLTLYKKTETSLEFLLCEDNDTDVLETDIYKLNIKF